MPIYEYQCEKCGYKFETQQKIKDEPLKTCPKCKGKVSKLISATAFTLKGSGWYKDGYSRPSSSSKSCSSCPPSCSCSGKKNKDKKENKTDKK